MDIRMPFNSKTSSQVPLVGERYASIPKANLNTYEQKTPVAEEDQPLKDIEYLDASYGTSIPKVWGTARVGGPILGKS